MERMTGPYREFGESFIPELQDILSTEGQSNYQCGVLPEYLINRSARIVIAARRSPGVQLLGKHAACLLKHRIGC